MQYPGGKSRQIKYIAPIVLSHKEERVMYEPFCGAMSATVGLQPYRASDSSKDIIDLYLAIRSGSFELPDECSKELYETLRHAPSSPLRTFIGFSCSFGGKWFGGYARNAKNQNYCEVGKRSLQRKIDATKDVIFTHNSYDDFTFSGNDIVYCDPPYAKTLNAYGKNNTFNSRQFWDWCKSQQFSGAKMFVSEISIPDDVQHEVVWEKERVSTMSDKDHSIHEKLYYLEP